MVKHKVVSVYIHKDLIIHAHSNTKIKNLSEWINDRYYEEYMKPTFPQLILQFLRKLTSYRSQK